MLRKLALPALLALVGACADPSAVDSDAQDGLVLAVTASSASITPGDTVRLVAHLANRNDFPVRLGFSSGCQALPYVEGPDGQIVYPQGGGWVCATVLTSLELAPGEVKEQVFKWTAQRSGHDWQTSRPVYTPLPAGEYRAYVVLNGSGERGTVTLRSNTEKVTVR
ncbi:MAG TPA: BsuPI-related putative proteinase inhibitor [Longimicrobiaceae bacterium]|nr:BsuPI-related putative proteinase inhibitor [Longimicrobiaceae bacterium]